MSRPTFTEAEKHAAFEWLREQGLAGNKRAAVAMFELERLNTPSWYTDDDEGGADSPQEYLDLIDEDELAIGDHFLLKPWRELGPAREFCVVWRDGKRTAVPVIEGSL